MVTSYAERLRAVTSQRGALCVGIDPHAQLLDAWGLSDDARGVETFGRRVVEALGQTVAVFKPQVAFFEAHGAAGLVALERVLADLRQTGALIIGDAKRGDIGTTMAGYARAWLSEESPLRCDAVTLSPYLGFESLRPALDAAHAASRGVYVLTRTSNPEGGDVQLATGADGVRVAQSLLDAARAENERTGGSVGVVIGGTHDDLGIDVTSFNGSILVPGIGAQGGTMAGVRRTFGPAADLALPAVSREVLQRGPDTAGLQDAVAGLLQQAVR